MACKTILEGYILAKERADKRLVECLQNAQGASHPVSRERAQALILAGKVYLGTVRIEKPGQQVDKEAMLTLAQDPNPFVSRGGLKLRGALDVLAHSAASPLSPKGMVVADLGASTGGFTDCLLQAGARHVYAVDVGTNLLHEKLQRDPRVTVMDKTNARYLDATHFKEKIDWVVIDASFISIKLILPAAASILLEGGTILAMVKPQFEVGAKGLKHGVVKDEALRQQAIDDVKAFATGCGLQWMGTADAPIKGPEGNQETFLYLKKGVA